MVNESMDCLICKKELFSEIGIGCKLCGMPLESEDEFCCKNCIKKYLVINGGTK
jgi:hypothetical protein